MSVTCPTTLHRTCFTQLENVLTCTQLITVSAAVGCGFNFLEHSYVSLG